MAIIISGTREQIVSINNIILQVHIYIQYIIDITENVQLSFINNNNDYKNRFEHIL